MLGSSFGQSQVIMNEWVTVRREERAIYTHRQNLTVRINVGSSDTDCWNLRRLIKTLFIHADSWTSSAGVRTPGGCWDFRLPSGLSTASRAWRLSPEHRDFRWPKSQKLYLSVREVLECLSFDFIFMLEHSISSSASLQYGKPKHKTKDKNEVRFEFVRLLYFKN